MSQADADASLHIRTSALALLICLHQLDLKCSLKTQIRPLDSGYVAAMFSFGLVVMILSSQTLADVISSIKVSWTN